MGQTTGHYERAHGQIYGYSNPSGFSTPATQNRVYSDARPPFRKAVWAVPQSGGVNRMMEPKETSFSHVYMIETPRRDDILEHTS
jgi:hypothetical protein